MFDLQWLIIDTTHIEVHPDGAVAQGKAPKMKVVIPSKKARKAVRSYDKAGYKLPHMLTGPIRLTG